MRIMQSGTGSGGCPNSAPFGMRDAAVMGRERGEEKPQASASVCSKENGRDQIGKGNRACIKELYGGYVYTTARRLNYRQKSTQLSSTIRFGHTSIPTGM